MTDLECPQGRVLCPVLLAETARPCDPTQHPSDEAACQRNGILTNKERRLMVTSDHLCEAVVL
jgi:hypothetical protein